MSFDHQLLAFKTRALQNVTYCPFTLEFSFRDTVPLAWSRRTLTGKTKSFSSPAINNRLQLAPHSIRVRLWERRGEAGMGGGGEEGGGGGMERMVGRRGGRGMDERVGRRGEVGGGMKVVVG
jgi:hypothetical protein